MWPPSNVALQLDFGIKSLEQSAVVVRKSVVFMPSSNVAPAPFKSRVRFSPIRAVWLHSLPGHLTLQG